MAALDLCDCGSGLPAARCCGLAPDGKAVAPASEALRALIETATQAFLSGAIEVAERTCLDGLDEAPAQPDLLWLLARLRASQGRQTAAEALVRRVVAIAPNAVAPTQDLGLRLLQRGALFEAEQVARNAVRISPEDPQSHNLLAMVLTESNRPQVGEYHYRQALRLLDDRPAVLLANLAWSLKLQGRIEEARALYRESEARTPGIFQTLLGWARLEEADRRFAASRELLDRAERLQPGNPSVGLLGAVLLARTGAVEAAIEALDRMAESRGQAGSEPALTPEELLQKGRLLDGMGRYDDAFDAFDSGKAQLRALTGESYAADEAMERVARLRGFFTAHRLASLPRAAVRDDGPQPVFVLGFPRSGTTLVEQTLTAHSAIDAGDELPFIEEIAELAPRSLGSPLLYPEALSELWMGDRRDGLDTLRDHYLQRVLQRGIAAGGETLFTDKMPLNETHLGLIGLLFPAAPLIHVLRHPLDSVLSAFSNLLTHGYRCAYALESAARHYALVSDLVAHVRGEMALRYLPVRYEDLVADQEGEVRRMFDFLGLPFEESCLRFHENRRYARTASYAQVTEPLYDRSRERWRHYRRQLAPIVPILEPAIMRLGYTVD